VRSIATGFGDDVDDTARGVAELGFVTGSNDLKLSDGVLIELRGRAAREFVSINGVPRENETNVSPGKRGPENQSSPTNREARV
jgi:hypothetical protein